MKNIVKMLGFIAVSAIIGFGFAACDDPDAGLPALTGTVTITGTAQVGQTLTANTGSLGGSGTITYQWNWAGSRNIGTNSNTYIVQTADVGSTITVTVTRADNSGSVTSNPTETITVLSNIEMVWIPAGMFTQGSPASEPGHRSDETQRQVTIIRGFYMGKYVVTQEQYQAVMGVNPSSFSGSNRPVEMVTWFDAVEFCNRLSVIEGLTPAYTITGRTPATGYPITAATVTVNWNANGYRLPTEAEWEYACRAGTTSAYNTGASITTSQANFGNTLGRTTAVGSYAPNAWGLYNMHGNVWEWCWDWYGTYASGAQTDPRGAGSGTRRMLRGGCWFGLVVEARSAYRFGSSPEIESGNLGFRLVRPDNLPILSGTVSITGTAQEGQTLTANTANLGGSGTISYYWMRDGVSIGSDSSTYVVQAADVGNTITVTGTAQVGQTLTANTNNLGGSGTITYQWRRGTTNIGSDSSTYVVQTADVGSTITVTVTRSGNSGSVTSDPTAIVIVVEMVFVPGGSFELGREIGTAGIGDVTPVSTVTLTGFHIGKYPVTQAQYQAVMGTNPSLFTTARGSPPATGETDARRPVEGVSWYDAIVFCNRLSILEGLTPAYSINGSTNPDNWGAVPTSNNAAWNAVVVVSGSTGYRLPTEAQWEYAAKGGNNPPVGFTYAGSNIANEVAWHSGNSGSRTREVGRLQPNGLGIYDMSGNVWEWCWDWWGNYTSEVKTDPRGAVSGADRVLRGGSWDNSAEIARSAYRVDGSPGGRSINLGFRLVRP